MPPGIDKTAMDFRRSLPEIRWQSCLSPVSPLPWAANRDMLVFYFSNRIQERYMARFARLKVLNTMIGTGLVPVFYHPNLEVACQVAAACLAGGCRLLEFTNRGDHAWEVFNELEKYCARELPDIDRKSVV